MLSKRRLGPWVLFALLVVLGWVSLRIVGVFLDYILIGVFLAFVTYPVYQRLRAYLRNGVAAGLVMVVLVVAVIVVPLVAMGIELFAQVQDIGRGIEEGGTQSLLNETSASLGDVLGVSPETGQRMVRGAYDAVRDFLANEVRDLPTTILTVGIGIFVLFYILYYTYLEGPQFLAFVRDLLPMDEGRRDLLFHELAQVTRGVMIGTVLTSLIQAVVGGIGFAIFGVENVLFWSALMFILALLPIIGPPVIWAPWGLWLLAQGRTFDGLGLLIWGGILVSTVDNIIRPKLIGHSAKVHPVTVLLGVVGGVAVFGFSGFILGPLVLSIFVTILQLYRKEFAARLEEMEAREVWLR